MLIKKHFFLFILLISLVVSGCDEHLYDEEEVYSFHEHLSDTIKGPDLLNAMDKAGIEQTILVGSYNAMFQHNQEPDWASSTTNNELLINAMQQAADRIVALPLIRGNEPNLLDYAKGLIDQGARGFVVANGDPRLSLMPLSDNRLNPLYAWCELHRIPILFLTDGRPESRDFFFPAIEQVMRDYPNMFVVVSHMGGLSGDLKKLKQMLEKFPRLFFDVSFGWEEDKLLHLNNLSNNHEEAKKIFDRYRDRLLFGMSSMVWSGPGRNVDWLSQYYLDFRRFFERSNMRLKLLLDGKNTIHNLKGLKLPKDILEFFYHHNFKNLINEHPSDYKKYNLDHLLTALPPQSVYDEKSSYRLVPALVTSHRNPIEGLHIAWLTNIFTGETTNWKSLRSFDQPIEVIAQPPLDTWLIKRLQIEKHVSIKHAQSADQIVQFLRENPGALALLPFAGVTAEMKVIPVDGESPTNRYVRDCSTRGGATIGTYFHQYPLLLPVKPLKPIAPEYIYDPYQIRHLVVGGMLLPSAAPPQVHEDLEAPIEPIFKLGEITRQAELSIFEMPYRIGKDCNTIDNRCLSADWMLAFDFLGIDNILAYPANDEPTQVADEWLRHSIGAINDNQTQTLTIRGQSLAFLVRQVPNASEAENQSNELAESVTQANEKSAVLVFLRLAQPTAEISALAGTLAHAAIDAGAQAVIISGYEKPDHVEFYHGHMIVHGLGDFFYASPNRPFTDIAMLLRFVFYRDHLIAVDLIPTQIKGEKIHPLHAGEGQKVLMRLMSS